ncbi:MAG: methyltransferase domain-containing protein, partial [Puniceicoccales bacterium]
MWDEAYDTDEYVFGTAPNDFLAQQYKHLPKGDILFLADGEGRNSVFLAGQGYHVTAVDNSTVGLKKAAALAKSKGVEVNYVHADLAEYDLGR